MSKDYTFNPIQQCYAPSGNHDWLPTAGDVMQCYCCPICDLRIYWSEINKKWVKVQAQRDKLDGDKES